MNEVPFGDLVLDARPGFASGRRDPQGVIQVRMNNVSNDGILNLHEHIRVPADELLVKHYRLEPGDILFNSTNSPDLVGKSAMFPGSNEPVVFSNHFLRLRLRTDAADPVYVTFWLVEQWRQRVFQYMCTQWVNQAAIRKERLLRLTISLPPLPDQQRFSAVFQSARAIRQKSDAAVQLLESLVRSVFQEIS